MGWTRWARPAEQRLDRLLASAAGAVKPHRPRVTAAYVGGTRVIGDVSGYVALFNPAPDARGPRLG